MSTQQVTFDPSQSYQPAISGKPAFDPGGSYQPATPKTVSSGAVSGVGRAISNLASMPGQFYDALTKEPQTDEEKSVHTNGVDTPQGHLPGALALPFWRLVGKPMADADDKAQQYEQAAASEQNPDVKKQLLDAAAAYRIGAKVPMVGPLAASLAERGAYGEQGASKLDPKGGSGWNNQNSDLSGAVAEGTTYAAAPAVTKAVGGAVLDNAGPAVRATTRAVNTVLQKAPGTVGAATGAAIGHATGVPYAGEVGAIIGGGVGREILPKVKLPGEGFGLPNRVTGGPASAPQFQPEEPVYPGASQPETPQPELLQAATLAKGSQVAVDPSAGLGTLPLSKLPVHAVNQAVQELGLQAPLPSLTARANQIANLAVEGAGGKLPEPLQPNVPLKNQGGIVTPNSEAVSVRDNDVLAQVKAEHPDWSNSQALQEAAKQVNPKPSIPEGHTAVESSALKSYKYDPQAQEFEAYTPSGGHYVYGDVSPEQAAKFEAADSKGKAWNDIRQNSTLVAKVINGKRVPIKPVVAPEDEIDPAEWEAGHAIESQVEGTPRR